MDPWSFRLDQALVYEDKDLLVVNKPAGLLTIRDEKNGPNLYSQLYGYVMSEGTRGARLFVVHRLDKDTSGLLVFAKNVRTKAVLQQGFEQGVVVRKYEAVCHGTVLPLGVTKRLKSYLFQDKGHNVFLASAGRGKICLTDACCLATQNGLSYLDIQIQTGRRNQIRLTLAGIGMPVVGDRKYGIKDKSPRMMLNAYRLAFPKAMGLRQSEFELPRSFSVPFLGMKGNPQ